MVNWLLHRFLHMCQESGEEQGLSPGPQRPQSGKLLGFPGTKSLGASAFGLGQEAAGGRSFAFGQMSPKLNR